MLVAQCVADSPLYSTMPLVTTALPSIAAKFSAPACIVRETKVLFAVWCTQAAT